MIKRFVCLILCTFLCSVSFTGCYDIREIEDLAYVIAIGIDPAENNMFNLTFQTAVPKAITTGEGESTDIKSFKTDNFLSGFKKTGRYLGKDVNLSHTKIIVISEELAKKGLLPFLNGLQNYMQLRPDVNIIIAAEGAKNYIESIKPNLTASPTKYYDMMFRSYESDFLVPSAQLGDYLYRVKSSGSQPVAIYTEIDKTVVDSKKPEDDKKGEKPEEGKKNMSIKGLAVFRGDKMAGLLDTTESSLYALLTGSIDNIKLEVTDPYDERFKILSNIRKEGLLKAGITVNSGKPRIDLNLRLHADIEAVQSDINYSDPSKTHKAEKAYEDYFRKNLKELLTKATYDYKSDIFGFGELARKNYNTISQWNSIKWNDIFQNTVYSVSVDVTVTGQEK
jgi:spore germination protein KC